MLTVERHDSTLFLVKVNGDINGQIRFNNRKDVIDKYSVQHGMKIKTYHTLAEAVSSILVRSADAFAHMLTKDIK